MRVLVTGATGYIGGRLVPRLVERGHQVRCIARDPNRLSGRGWDRVEIIGGDLGDRDAVCQALQGIDVAYYLVHSMASEKTFRERDLEMATIFGEEARRAGVQRIIYLGGLGDPESVRSKHLVSRQEVGRALAAAGVPTVEFRAAVIVGSGSVSFEMLRALTERLSIMITPRWVETRCQPISVRDVLDYLMEALEHPEAQGIYEIGGRDVLTYREMMLTYAHMRGLHRVIRSLPVPRPQLSSRFVDLFTPIPYRLADPLIESLRTEMVVNNDRARHQFRVEPMGYTEALTRALARVATDMVETTWASSITTGSDRDEGKQLATNEGMLYERHRARVASPPDVVFAEICALGGDSGWPAGNTLWQIRGMMDRVVGGVGMRRGRRHPRELRVGEPLDFWRVEAMDTPRLLRLRAEMKLPGEAWLQFEVSADGEGSILEQTAFYDPRGLTGYLYWYAVVPFHRFIFPGLVASVRERSEAHRPTVVG
ncbi:MAG: SDR family oxidoreductase [Ilumatobacteraceae bacterium]